MLTWTVFPTRQLISENRVPPPSSLRVQNVGLVPQKQIYAVCFKKKKKKDPSSVTQYDTQASKLLIGYQYHFPT